MTRNVKRFLAVSLLSLTPSIAFAGQDDFGFSDFLTQRSEFVSVREGAIEIPALRGAPAESFGPALENLFVQNQTTSTLSLGLQTVTGTFNGVFNPYPCPPASLCGYQVAATSPGVPPTPPVVQQYYWTANPSNPAAGKTCVWRLEVSVDAANNCAATVFFGTYGGAVCTVDAARSFIDPATCQTQIVTNIQ
ncbi:hypothetical protein JY651_18025 [Pyxidicoccus parkwayensis]|uniref:Uncharacterized protein n=1 Tax=Pyxidicoccus parkwayensis TaxID=2813578 RepID=A0ABX7P869_9BACT|nr:hypothetical protein [Pyxidicoccus parkwaysis]QSQ26708.1 hypothetical protein JY651_18025 [Pyxidicoccus parkwaysis]